MQVGGPGSHLVAHLSRANCLVVVPEDVKNIATAVLSHRVILQPDAELQGRTGVELIARAVQSVPVPRTVAAS